MRCLVAVLLGFVLCTGGANAYASPLWGSDEIRVKRALAETDVLAFDLHRSSSGSARPVGETDSVVTLAQDFSLVAGGGHFDLEDHSLCRSLTWTSGATVLENNSCFAAVAFREMEVQNRAILAQVLSKTGTTGSGQLRYFAEAELGVSAPNAPPSALKEKAKGDTVEYRLGSTVVVRVSGSAGELNTEETRRFLRFLARYTPLHPQVRHDIAATRRLPARIEVELGQAKVGDGRHVMTFSNVRRTRSAYPLPAGMGSALARQASSGSNPRDLAVRRIAAVLAGVDPKPTLQSAFALAREAAAAGRDLEVMLLALQLSQDYMATFTAPANAADRAAVTEFGALLRPRLSSGQAGAFFTASNLAGNSRAAGDRQAAARFLALSPQMDLLPFGTFRRVTYANLVTVTPSAKDWDPDILKAMPARLVDNYWIHIAAHPWASNAYRDAGQVLLGSYEAWDAWMAFDLGRAVDPAWRTGTMAALSTFEDELKARQPDFF